MEFTAESVQNNFSILQKTKEPTQRIKAEKYLSTFKSHQSCIQISTELLNNSDKELQLFAAISIYKYIENNISSIIDNKTTYDNYKTFLLNQIFPKLSLLTNKKSILNICSAITIMVLSGSITYWFESIDDVMEMSQLNESNWLYGSMILGDIHHVIIEHQLISLKTSKNIRERIMTRMSDKFIYYIDYVFQKVQFYKSNKNPLYNELLINLLNLAISVAKCRINILQVPNLVLYFLTTMPSQVHIIRDLICELLNQTFKISTTKKQIQCEFEIKRWDWDVRNPEFIKYFLNYVHEKEVNIICSWVTLIDNWYMNYSQKPYTSWNENEKDIWFYTANVFSAICSNFIFLFFTKSDYSSVSATMYKLFLYFISLSNRKISQLLFQSIEEMKWFVNDKYLLSNFSTEEKEIFKTFWFKVNEAIICNSKLSHLNINYSLIQKKWSQADISNILNELDEIDESNNEIDIDDIGVITYRQNCEDAYGYILELFEYNYSNKDRNQGIILYFETLGNLMISKKSVLNDTEYLILVESIIFNVKCVHCLLTALPDVNQEVLVNFSWYIWNSDIVTNEKLSLSYVIYLNSLSEMIWRNEELFDSSIKFLLLKYRETPSVDTITSLVLHNIVIHNNKINTGVYELLYSFYINKFKSISTISIAHFVAAMIRCLICKIISVDQEALSISVNNIWLPITQWFTNNQNIIQADLIKIFEVYHRIIESIGKANHWILFNIIQTTGILTPWFNWINQLITSEEHYTNTWVMTKIVSLLSTIIITLMNSLYNVLLDKSENTVIKKTISSKFFVICKQIMGNIVPKQNEFIGTWKEFAGFFGIWITKIYNEFIVYEEWEVVLNFFFPNWMNYSIDEIEKKIYHLVLHLCSSQQINDDIKGRLYRKAIDLCIEFSGKFGEDNHKIIKWIEIIMKSNTRIFMKTIGVNDKVIVSIGLMICKKYKNKGQDFENMEKVIDYLHNIKQLF